MPGVEWPQIRAVAAVVREVLHEHHLVGRPKTSGSRGIHVLVRIERRWSFDEVRRAALALAREVERRAPDLATAQWWKAQRHGVFVDYNQNAKDRTVASAYSMRPRPDARVSMPPPAAHLQPADVLVDKARGASSVHYRVRINLEHVPPRLRPKSDKPDKL